MADPTTRSEPVAESDDTSVTFHVKSSGDKKYTFTLPLSTTTLDLKNKLAEEQHANIPATSQRLIYSGKVLKDGDTLAAHNVKEGNTMHLVKSAASNQRQNPQSPSSANSTSTSTPQATGVPENIAAGTGNNPLAGLTGARYAGFQQLPSASMFGNEGGVLGGPPSPEQIIRQLQDPNFAQMMREALNNPQVVDLMIQQNPQLRAMGPQARQVLQSEQFRRMMTDPEALRQMAQMQQMFGMPGTSQEAFPAPGTTTTTENPGDGSSNATTNPAQPQNPMAALGGMGANPFAGLFNPGMMGQQPPSTGTPGQTDTNLATSTQQQQNPFAALFNPALFGNPSEGGQNQAAGNPQITPDMMQRMAAMFGGGTPGANPYGNMFGDMFGGAQAAPDNRPPEERYETQLGQLNGMGFHDFDRNVQALRRSGGDINGALEWLFTNPAS